MPGVSPAEALIADTVPFISPDVFIPILGICEILIGLGFLTAVGLRAAILLLFLQMPGTMAPIFLLPDRVFTIISVALTIEGQYIVKNLVLISAALVIGATVRGGYVVTERGGPDAAA